MSERTTESSVQSIPASSTPMHENARECQSRSAPWLLPGVRMNHNAARDMDTCSNAAVPCRGGISSAQREAVAAAGPDGRASAHAEFFPERILGASLDSRVVRTVHPRQQGVQARV